MLVQIEKIEGLGVFNTYKRKAELLDFGKYNVFYGLNGSGKSTLSKLFSCLNAGGSTQFSDLKYTIKTKEGNFSQGTEYPTKIRVFNADFIHANIGQIEGKINPIFIIGEENKELATQITNDEQKLSKYQNDLSALNEEQEKLKKQRGSKFTDIAKIIASDSSGQVTRTYRKNNAEVAFNRINQAAILPDKVFEEHKTTVRQNNLDSVPIFSFDTVSVELDGNDCKILSSEALVIFSDKVADVCKETSITEVIDRLRENPDISTWVEEGIDIRKNHQTPVCEFCFQTIPESRLSALKNHFNDSDNNLKIKIQSMMQECEGIRKNLEPKTVPGKHQFYDEFQEPFKKAIDVFYEEKIRVSELADAYLQALEEKLSKRTEIVDFGKRRVFENRFSGSIDNINKIISTHNLKSENFESSLAEARRKIEHHHLSTIKEEVDQIDRHLEELKGETNILNFGNVASGAIGIEELKQTIIGKKAKVANLKIASDKLNDMLHTFLGRSDLEFEPDEFGYRIIRNGKVAKRLSEGEKTAITFIYFIVHLSDQDFDINEGIVVIDDPVSSLDSNSLYQAFSFLKGSVKMEKQIFIFTHNFDFLKLLLNWFHRIPKREGKNYYMLLCTINQNGDRSASIAPLDKELLENKNEYTFLFKQLFNFRSDGTIAGSYHVPNIARKLLESFLDFYYPGSESMYKKMEKVDFDENKKTAILKFSNDLSHPTGKGFDPALVPETQNNVKFLLEMIEAVSPIHFSSLKASINVASST